MNTHTKFSASVNIERDAQNNLLYIVTENAKEVFRQIAFNFENTAQHSFTIVGAYGSGKSAFLWALEQTLLKKKDYFPEFSKSFNKIENTEILKIIGENQSLTQSFGEILGLETQNYNAKNIIKKLDEWETILNNEKKKLIIILDEFGKFLEHASKNNPDSELYFIQQLAEWVNNDQKNVILITTLHQGFFAYSHGLTQIQRNEWQKVEGRLKELTFNEPIEQLLYLASEHLVKNPQIKKCPKNFENLFLTIKNTQPRLLKDNYNLDFAKKITFA